MPAAGPPRPVGVAEPQPLAVPAGQREDPEHRRVDRGSTPDRDRRRLQGGDPAAQARGQHLLERRRDPDRRVLGTGHRAGCGELQAHRDGHRRLVVQQQRGQFPAGAERVAAGRAGGGLHPVAELAQALDVAAHGPRGDAEPVGQVLAAPGPRGGEQRQQPQDADGRIGHALIVDDPADEI